MTHKEIKEMFSEMDRLRVYLEVEQEHYYLQCRDKFYKTGELNHGHIETLQNILRRLRAVAAEPKPVVERVIKPNPEKDEIDALFDVLFASKGNLNQEQYMHLLQCHTQWRRPLEQGGGSLTWQQKYNLRELLKWLKANYGERQVDTIKR